MIIDLGIAYRNETILKCSSRGEIFMLKKLLKTIKGLYVERYSSMAFQEVHDQAERGHAGKQLSLAIMYETGTAAVKQDLVAAYYLYYLAAEKGIIEAADKLYSLEYTMPAALWREAKDMVSRLKENEEGT